MRIRLVTMTATAGGVARHVDELSAGLATLGWEVVRGSGPADIVHVHLHDTYDRRALGLVLRARTQRVPVVITEHLPRTNASDPSLLPGRRRRGAARAKTSFKRAEARLATRIVTVSHRSQTFLLDRYRLGPPKVATVLNGVTLPTGATPASLEPGEILRVVSIGTLNVQKGHDILVEAARRSRRDWHASVIGTGSARTALERSSASLRTASVSFAGWRDDAVDAPVEAHVLCLPSRWEACPYVVLDAMARARCVVASSVDGVPELVEDGVTGLLVPPDDPDALADALDQLAGRPELVSRMGAAARARAERSFGIERMVRETEAVYREALSA